MIAKDTITRNQLMKHLHREMFKTQKLIDKGGKSDINVEDRQQDLYNEVNELHHLVKSKARIWIRSTTIGMDKFFLHYMPKYKSNTADVFLDPAREIPFKRTPCPKDISTKVQLDELSVSDLLHRADELLNSNPIQKDLDKAASLILYGLQSLGERNEFMIHYDNELTFMSKDNAHRYLEFFKHDLNSHSFHDLHECKSKYVIVNTSWEVGTRAPIIQPVTKEALDKTILSINQHNNPDLVSDSVLEDIV